MRKKRASNRFRFWISRLAALTLALLVIVPAVSLRPVDRSPRAETLQYREAVGTVSLMSRELKQSSSSALRAGWSAVPMTTKVGDPLAGYGARRGAPSTGKGETLYVRSLCLQNDRSEVFLIATDLLLVHAGVAEKVSGICEAEGIEPKAIYYTATHTHCGPGGWGPNIIEEAVCGDYDEAVVERISRDIADAILESRKQTQPASWSFLQADAPAFLRNRTVKSGPVDASLDAIAVRHTGSGNLGVFAFYGAHATCLGSDRMSYHRDYPGAFVRAVESEAIPFAAFGAASVGSQSPVGKGDETERANSIGEGLAQLIQGKLETAEWKDTIDIAAVRGTVPLPDFQIRISGNIRIAEWIANGIHPTRAPLHFLRLDRHWLAGLPVEYSGLLSLPLRKEMKETGYTITPTAFNGDYIGYVLPPEIYDGGSYEAQMNFLGPGGGAYFTDLIRLGTGLSQPD